MKFKNYTNSVTKNNRIYSKEDVYNMPVGEAYKRKRELMAQNRSIGIPTTGDLQNSANAIWVESYVRSDGTPVKGYWRSRPEGGNGDFAPPNGDIIIDENPNGDYKDVPNDYPYPEPGSKKDGEPVEDAGTDPIGALVELVSGVLQVFMPESELVETLQKFSPLIQMVLSKVWGGFEEGDFSDLNPFGEEENKPVEPQGPKDAIEAKVNDGVPTGQASKVEDTNDKLGEMAKWQETTIKDMNSKEAQQNPEYEYYKIAFDLKTARETGKIPEWIKENNDVITVKDIKDKDLQSIVEDKIIKSAKLENDTKTLNNTKDVYVIVPKQDTKLTEILRNNPDLQREIETRLQDIKDGKYENDSFSMEFKNKKVDFINYKNGNVSAHNTIGKCDVYNVKYEQGGYVSMTIVDYYDFSKSKNPIVNNGYEQQQHGDMENYINIIRLRKKIKK